MRFGTVFCTPLLATAPNTDSWSSLSQVAPAP
jgi:hypothetical protein